MSSRQPSRAAWILDHLNYEQSILLGLSIDSTTAATYSSATNSYLTFCKKHQQSMELMAETLSYYINYQTHFISPDSIDSYLSRIINQLEPYHLDVYKHWGSLLVKQTLKGAWRMYSKGVCQRETLVSPGFRVHVNVIGRIILIWEPTFQSTAQHWVHGATLPGWIG